MGEHKGSLTGTRWEAVLTREGEYCGWESLRGRKKRKKERERKERKQENIISV